MIKTKLEIDFKADREGMSHEELVKYKSHPDVGADMIATKPFVTKGILQLIREHEEAKGGDGFPNKKDLALLPVSSQALAICNEFDRQVALRASAPEQVYPNFFKNMLGRYEMKHLKLLGDIIAGK